MEFSRPNITKQESDAVAQAILDGHLADGVLTQKFEDKFKEMFDYRYVVAVNSGTSALQLALQALGVRHGDEVIVPAYGIMCTVNAIASAGGTPVFGDIERHSYHLDSRRVNALRNSKTKVVLPVSLFGVPCDIKKIRAELPHIPILEDSVECLGAKRNGRFIGQDVEAAVFGFFPNKQITTGQGGVVVSNRNESLIETIRRLSKHGYGPYADLWNPGYGYNMRMPDYCAAMGIVQLGRLQEMQDRLNEVRSWLDSYFQEYRRQTIGDRDTPTNFVYVIELPFNLDKKKFCEAMTSNGVPVRPYFNSLHNPVAINCKIAEIVGRKTVALPFHCGITKQDVEQIYKTYEGVLDEENVYIAAS